MRVGSVTHSIKKEALAHSSILQQVGVPKNNLRVGTYTDLVQDYPLQTVI